MSYYFCVWLLFYCKEIVPQELKKEAWALFFADSISNEGWRSVQDAASMFHRGGFRPPR